MTAIISRCLCAAILTGLVRGMTWVMPHTRVWPFKADSEAWYSPHFWHVRRISTDCADGQLSMHRTAWTGSLLENEEAHRISLPVPGRESWTLSQSDSLVQELSHLQVFAVVESVEAEILTTAKKKLNSCVACSIHYLRTWLSECSTDFHGHALLSTAWKLFWGHPAAFHFQICLVRCTHWSLGGYQSPDHFSNLAECPASKSKICLF